MHSFKGHADYLTEEPPGDTGLIQLLLAHRVVVSASQSAFQWLGNTLNLLSVLFLLVLIGSIAYQARTGQRLAFGVGQSRARMYTEERPKVTFAAMASNEEAKEDLQEIVDYLREPSRYTKVGARIPHGVLLSGPPGTGKTLMARAVAGEAKVPFFSVAATEFVEMFVGVGAARIRDLFERAKKVAPSIIFVDEIDAIGRQRSTKREHRRQRRARADPQSAVGRDGRVRAQPERHSHRRHQPARHPRRGAPAPGPVRPQGGGRAPGPQRPACYPQASREQGRDGAGCRPRGSRAQTPGFSGADLATVINEAALSAARDGCDKVTQRDLEAAYDKVILGARRRFALSEEDKKRVAVHEGGHALVGYFLPGVDPVEKVTIVPRGRALGVTQFSEDDRFNIPEHYVRARLAVALGGRAGEQLVLGEVSSGAENDLEVATNFARRMVERWGMGERLGPVSFPRDGASPAAQLGLPSTSPALADQRTKRSCVY